MNGKIAILHSANLKDISPGGVSEYVSQFIKNSESEIVLFGTESKSEDIKLFKQYKRDIGGKEYTFVPINFADRRPLSIFYFFNLFFFLIFNPKLRKQITAFYAQRMEYVLPFYFFLGKKVSFAVHGSGKYASMFWGKKIAYIYGLLERLSIIRSQKVFVLNNNKEYGVPYYKDKYRKHSWKIFYTSVPVDQSFFVPLKKENVRNKYNFSSDDKVILFFGRLEHNPKRIFLLPNILNEVKKRHINAKMLIIGSGNDRSELVGKFNSLGLDDSVTYFEHLNHDFKLVEIINCADLSVVCSSFEGICMSALESLSCNIPVVATNVGSIKDYLIDGYNGFFINDESEEYIIKTIAEKIDHIFISGLTFENEKIRGYDSKLVIESIEKQLLDWMDK
jgi:glycosyltransferase involved in cell wall biosynthesis